MSDFIADACASKFAIQVVNVVDGGSAIEDGSIRSLAEQIQPWRPVALTLRVQSTQTYGI